MLVLTRKQSETIRIGENIVIKVIRTGRGAVKIGVEAPLHVRVVRGELPPKPEMEESGCSPFALQTAELVETVSDRFPRHLV
jgi:carbon storage regulator CsrA